MQVLDTTHDDYWIDDDITERYDIKCPKCEGPMRQRECTSLGCDDGYYDGYEDDPLWYDEGDLVPCGECRGRGFFQWCPNPNCGKGQP